MIRYLPGSNEEIMKSWVGLEIGEESGKVPWKKRSGNKAEGTCARTKRHK